MEEELIHQTFWTEPNTSLSSDCLRQESGDLYFEYGVSSSKQWEMHMFSYLLTFCDVRRTFYYF